MEIRNNIYSVGVIDREIRMFHGYQTPFGTTYNSYLILDEKVTLIDLVKSNFTDEFIFNIKNILGDRQLDYIICNHIEPDHSGAFPAILKLFPQAMVYGTSNCEKGLKAYYPECKYDFVCVKSGDNLSTGKFTFNFIPMPMVHWPDSMATYLLNEKILFSNDAFGQHIGTGELTDDQLDLEELIDRAADYYANIVLPFSSQVKKVLDIINKYNIDIICPSHGVILTNTISKIINKYIDWSNHIIDDNKVVIIYDTMWGTTKKLAYKLNDEYIEKGFNVKLINLSQQHYSYAMTSILEAKYVFIGSPTLNNQMLPTVSAFLTYMKGLKPKNKTALAFGSYGWSGESISQINDMLLSCGCKVLEPVKVLWNI